jgi:hypothetical protein
MEALLAYKLGRRPNDPSKPRLRLAHHTTGLTPPPSATWTGVPAWGVLGNDEYGDCTCAGDGHIAEILSFYGQGTEAHVTTAEALRAYHAISGFDPAAGPPGDNPTDQGATVQAALSYLRRHGMAGVRINAFAEVSTSDLSEIKAACAALGPLSAGVNLPANAQQQFADGEPWDAVAGDGGIEGGHCIVLAGYDEEFLYFVTWGKVQKATYAWWAKYGEEIWAVVSREWAGAQGKDPEGVDLASLGAEFTALTGERDPFALSHRHHPAHAQDHAVLLDEFSRLVREIAASTDRHVGEAVHWLDERNL